jgi:uncharacterized membrane protein YqjE
MDAPRYRTEFDETNYSAQAKPVSALLKELVSNISLLVRQELMLARAEMGEKTSSLMNGVISIACGFVLALAALIVLLDAVVLALSNSVPMWASALIVGGVVAVIAAIFIYIGQSRLSAANMMPDRTVRNMRDDARVIREKV